MRNIKIKDIGSKTIKSLDKTITGLKNTKDNLVDVKNNVDNISIKEESVNQGASDKIITNANYIKATTINTIPKVGNRSLENTKKNKIKLKNKWTKKLTEKTVKNTIKTGNKVIKKSVITTKNTINNTKRTALAIKLAIMGTKALVSALVAGGWIALVSSRKVSNVAKNIDNEIINKTELIKTQNVHDEVILKVDRAS